MKPDAWRSGQDLRPVTPRDGQAGRRGLQPRLHVLLLPHYLSKQALPGGPGGGRIDDDVLLDEDWARFLKEHRFLVGLSIDWPREVRATCGKDRSATWKMAQQLRAAPPLAAAPAGFQRR